MWHTTSVIKMTYISNIVLVWAVGVLLVAGETPPEVPRVQLAGELNVGFELVARCSTLQYESKGLCNGLKPYRLYGDKSSGCLSYFWCSPEHAACMMACPTGTVFNQACNCCQDSAAATAAAFDTRTCSSALSAGAEQQMAGDTTAPARKLLVAEDSSSSSSSEVKLKPTATEEEVRTARAKARLAKRKRREEALRAAADRPGPAKAAAAADSISSNSQLPIAKRKMARRYSRTGVWNSYGKKYTGAWADKNVVKEPAVRVPSVAADATPPSAAVAEAVTESAAVAGTARRLYEANAAAAASPTAGEDTLAAASHSVHVAGATKRAMKMKRMQRLAVQAAAAAAAAGDPADTAATADAIEQQVHGGEHHKFKLRQKLRPMDKKPAAKAIDPEDEKGAPFAEALATAAEPHQRKPNQ